MFEVSGSEFWVQSSGAGHTVPGTRDRSMKGREPGSIQLKRRILLDLFVGLLLDGIINRNKKAEPVTRNLKHTGTDSSIFDLLPKSNINFHDNFTKSYH